MHLKQAIRAIFFTLLILASVYAPQIKAQRIKDLPKITTYNNLLRFVVDRNDSTKTIQGRYIHNGIVSDIDTLNINGKFIVNSNGEIIKWDNKTIEGLPADSNKILYSNGKWKTPTGGLADTSLAYTWTGLHTLTQDSLRINTLWYDFPSTRIANSVLYDSLGNGVLKWKAYTSGGTTIDTTKISYLAKNETFTGTKTLTGINFASAGYLSLPNTPQTTTGRFWFRDGKARLFDGSVMKALIDSTYFSGTANQLTYWSGTNSLGALTTATYPSLTEISYVKGVTSSIQTQLNSKLSSNQTITLSGDVSGSGTTSITAVVADDSHAHTGSTISGLSVSDFTSANISQWTNNSNYITLGNISGTSPISYNNSTGAISFLFNTTNTWTGDNYFDGAAKKTYFGAGHHLQLPNFAGSTGGMIKYDTFVQKVYVVNNSGIDTELAYQNNVTIPPSTNTNNNIPLWDGANSKTLKDGLAYTSAATASTIVGRDGNAQSAFNTVTLGTTSQYGQLYIFGTSKNTLITSEAATTDKWVEIPNLSGEFLLTTSPSSAFPTLNQNTTGNAATATTATKLATARTINGISFDGTANITIPTSVDQAANYTWTGLHKWTSALLSSDTTGAYFNSYTATSGADIKGLTSYVYTSSNPTANKIYGGMFNAVGSGTSGGSQSYGIYANASGSNTSYAGYFTAKGTAGDNYAIYADASSGSYNAYAGYFANGLVYIANGFLNVAGKFAVNTNGQITLINNTSPTAGYVPIGNGSHYEPVDLFAKNNVWTGSTAFTPESFSYNTTLDASGKTSISAGGSGNGTTTTISNGVAGQILILINTSSSFTWTLNETGNINLAGTANYVMGTSDTITLIYESGSAKWLETSRSDN